MASLVKANGFSGESSSSTHSKSLKEGRTTAGFVTRAVRYCNMFVYIRVCVCVEGFTLRYVCFTVYLPQRVDIEQRWLQLCQLYGRDAHRPDVTKFIVAAFNLHGCNLWCHPEDRRGTTGHLNVTDTAAWRTSQREILSSDELKHQTSEIIESRQIKTET